MVVMVATVRALKMHGGGPKVVAGRPLDPVYTHSNLEFFSTGLSNLRHHIQAAGKFNVPVVVAINYFAIDTYTEL